MGDIYDRALLILFEGEEEEEVYEEVDTEEINQNLFITGMTFGEFCKKHYESKHKPKEAVIIHDILTYCAPQVDIASKLKISAGIVNGLWRKIRENDIGYLTEKWCAKNFDIYIIGGNQPFPDGIDKGGRIITIKFRYDRRKKAIEYDQEVDFNPSRTLANFLRIPYYLINIYPQWDDQQLKIIKILPSPKLGSRFVSFNQETNNVNLNQEPEVPILKEILEEKGITGIKAFFEKIKDEQHYQTTSTLKGEVRS
jgi:hypothetical protein